jgi:flagellar biosynthesis/type III secretory pathway M-ring protein FliF/YscJ
VKRGLVLAVVFAALYVATGIFFAVLRRLDARAAQSATVPGDRHPSRAEKKAQPAPNPDLPAYMQPGFQEEVQARRRVEDELEAVEKERDSLRAKVRHLESELESLRSRADEPDSEPDGHVVPLSRR